MLKQLYVDNFRALVNFEITFGAVELWLGTNGSGKSSVFDILEILRKLLTADARVLDLFPAASLTRWQKRTVQTIELKLQDALGEFAYHLEVEHEPDTKKVRIAKETLSLEGKPLFSAGLGQARLFKDSHEEGQPLLVDWFRSGVAMIQPSSVNKKLVRFRELMSKVFVVRIDPRRMDPRADEEHSRPSEDFSDFSAWYRHITQEQAEKQADLYADLGKVIEGFDKLRLVQHGESARDLRVFLRTSEQADQGQSHQYRFMELSDGQRALIALYTLLHCATGSDHVLLLDELDNFVALAELQPFVVELVDTVRRLNSQAIFISHHPELIDYLAADGARLFHRRNGGPVRVRDFVLDPASGLKASEVVARGWEHGP